MPYYTLTVRLAESKRRKKYIEFSSDSTAAERIVRNYISETDNIIDISRKSAIFEEADPGRMVLFNKEGKRMSGSRRVLARTHTH